ncbi:MAG: PDR/VanB family oxidoreductase [Methyloversatilis sp.]|uniref:PDR/VanB family oxidoreductase n=1 Tax=Methyloversatilis sp. TaxID=2569862 RepID=UPI000DB2BC9C|nr:PDR/VanB family oxidoreductase [Methyloversatilis sp.]MCR6664974.1 PDR/VanB family oxidoreductase [Methyloversatilis sp.]PZU53880.1 MAG: ferredoxin--NADP(+) reductase [Thauera sp.]
MSSASLNVEIRRIRELAPGIREFSLSRTDGEDFPVYSGGSHIVLSLPLGERPHRNPYSLLGDPTVRDTWRVAVRKQEESRGGSRWLHEQAHEGMRIDISAPVNLFPLIRTGRRHILVAGGIGITPILSQARELARLGADFEVHYAYRGPEYGVFSDELEALAPGRVHHYVQSRREQIEFGSLLAGRPLGTHFYICGPAGMVAASMNAGKSLGWPESHLHSEQFLAPTGGEPFDVKLALSGKAFTVPSDLSLLEAIEQQGVDAPYLCRGGACGQCELEVLGAEGELIHHDLYLSADERASGKKIMPCVSRLKGGCLTLNL